MEIAKEPIQDPPATHPAAARGESPKPIGPIGSRSRNAAAKIAGLQALRVVALGRGTGLSALLQGLKLHTLRRTDKTPLKDISAIVTVSDDGGSSGRLRRTFDILAPGDIRNCMVALAEDEALLSRLFQYRFSNGKGLEGHSFGNLFLTALTHVTGDFHQVARRNRASRCHYVWTRVALHQHHSQSFGGRYSRRHRAIESRQDLYLQLDVAARRDRGFHRRRPRPRDP